MTGQATTASNRPAAHESELSGVYGEGIVAGLLGAATVALWFTVVVRGMPATIAAAAVMGVAVCGMHYTGMAAMSVRLDVNRVDQVHGIRPLMMIVPITLITAATIVGVALSALQAMTEEEFSDGAPAPRRGVHAESTAGAWSLKQANLASANARRPSPRPVPMGSTSNS